jgi:ferrous iron transport protein B
MRDSQHTIVRPRTVALAGNPNSGKTTVFNALTGLRHKVGNYPGVTVEKKVGKIQYEGNHALLLLDLPGTYSLNANSPDERIATDILLGRADHTERPDLVVCVVDAANLERNLYLVSQILDQGIPTIIALNMMDIAESQGARIDSNALARQLGIPVIPMIASRGQGIQELRVALRQPHVPLQARSWHMPEPVEREWEELAGLLQKYHRLNASTAHHEALALLTTAATSQEDRQRIAPEVLEHLAKDWQKLEFLGYNRQTVAIDARYHWIRSITRGVSKRTFAAGLTTSDRIDSVVTHHVWGIFIFLAVMALMFQTIFSWAETPMNWIGHGFDWIAFQARAALPPGDMRDLLLNGALAGVASVTMFLPQILLLFFFLGFLEDTGYMARAALIMDRFMSRFGLHGKSFIPLLSSFACAIPGIMATRTIENQRDRLATMLVAPLISCSARLPVYSLLIAATIPSIAVLHIVSLPALVMFSMYFLGLVAALSIATLFKKTLLRGAPPVFYMELPPYKLPGIKSILVQMGERALLFVRNAGTIILGASILLWFFASYPRLEGAAPSEQLQHSLAGRLGRAIEPVIRPLGFDWKIGIGLVSSVFQREMFVSTMGTIYNIQSEDNAATMSLKEQMQRDIDPQTGRALFSPLTGVSLMIFYVLSMQCISTVAVMRRETNGWKWPIFQIAYMTAMAYIATFAVHRVGVFLGIGV